MSDPVLMRPLLASSLAQRFVPGRCYLGFSAGRADVRFGELAGDNPHVKAGHTFNVTVPELWELVEAIAKGVSRTNMLKQYNGQFISVWEPIALPAEVFDEIRALAYKRVGIPYGFLELPGCWVASRAANLPLLPQSARDSLAGWVLRRFDQVRRLICHLFSEEIWAPARKYGYVFGVRDRRGPDYMYDHVAASPSLWRCIGEGVLVVDVEAPDAPLPA